MLSARVYSLAKLPNNYLPSLLCVRGLKRRRRFKQHDTPEPDWGLLQACPDRVFERRHMEREYFTGEFDLERPKGVIYDKKPFKVLLEADKMYAWCTCGHSKSQPFCDGRHKKLDTSQFVKPAAIKKYRPIRFKVDETKEYWLCNCKQTNNAPYCDLTHRRDDIQAAIRS